MDKSPQQQPMFGIRRQAILIARDNRQVSRVSTNEAPHPPTTHRTASTRRPSSPTTDPPILCCRQTSSQHPPPPARLSHLYRATGQDRDTRHQHNANLVQEDSHSPLQTREPHLDTAASPSPVTATKICHPPSLPPLPPSFSIMSDELKLVKEQLKSLEVTVKNYENHIFMLQGDLQYTQKAFQMEQNKMQAQIGSLVGLILDVFKENRHYEETREAQLLQKLSNIMNVNDDYSSLNSALNGTATSMATDANSLINGTIASLTNSGTPTANTTAILPSSGSRISTNDQLLAPSSLQQPSQNQLIAQSHNVSQQQQLQQLQQMGVVQKNFQQMQQQQSHHNQSRMQQQQQQQLQQQQIQQQQQQQQQQQHLQQQQQQQQHRQSQSHKSQSRHQSSSHQHHHTLNPQTQIQQQRQSQSTPVDQEVVAPPVTKRRKTNTNRKRNQVQTTTDAASILEDTLNVTVGNSRHVVPIALSPNSDGADKDKPPRKVYDKEYAFIKAPTSVEEIWNEYALGLNGQPSIKSLEVEYKTGWRRDPATSKKFNRRKAIYHAIEKGVSKGFSVDVCIRLLEDYRFLDREKNLKQPIGWLCHGNVPPELR